MGFNSAFKGLKYTFKRVKDIDRNMQGSTTDTDIPMF